jgi:hypothetical protein
MNWFLGIISKKPFLEWEIEKFIHLHPQSRNTSIKHTFYFTYDCNPDMLFQEPASEDDPYQKIVMGRGYLSKSTGFSSADKHDWHRLLKQDYIPSDIDGHYIAMKYRETFFQLTTDLSGHYPIFYAKSGDYIIISNQQHLVAGVITDKKMSFSGLSGLGIMSIPILSKGILDDISIMSPGSTITIKHDRITLTNRNYTFLSDTIHDRQKYIFTLKKAFELQLAPNEFMSIPFDNTFASRYAFSVWCHKSKRSWGIHYLKNALYKPDKYIDPYILSDLQIYVINEHFAQKPENPAIPLVESVVCADISSHDPVSSEVWDLYRSHVLTTGLAHFPTYFPLAGYFKKKPGMHEINLFTDLSDWMFEKEPLLWVDKLFKNIKSNSFSAFSRSGIIDNHFFKKDFYALLVSGAKEHFAEAKDSVVVTHTDYDLNHSFQKNYQMRCFLPGFAWLNDFRHFYSPGTLYTLCCAHIKQTLMDKKFYMMMSKIHESNALQSAEFPKMRERQNVFPELPHLNYHYFPLIAEFIQELIDEAEDVPLYDMGRVSKIFKKAQKQNKDAIDIILKWTAFEIYREYIL